MQLALSMSKINDGVGFKDNVNQFLSHQQKKNKEEFSGARIKTIKSQRARVKRAIFLILAKKILK